MRKLRLVFNTETGRYNVPEKLNEQELAQWKKATNAYTSAKEKAHAFLTSHSAELDEDELRRARAINKRITDAANDLHNLGFELDYKNYLI